MLPVQILTALILPMAALEQPTSSAAPRLDPLSDSLVAAPEPRLEHASTGGLYLRLSGGLVTTEDSDGPGEDVEFNEGFLLGAAIGQRVTSGAGPINVDLELEALWTQQDADDSGVIQAVRDVTVMAGMFNAIADFELMERLSLYGGGGVGVAWMDVGTRSDAIASFDSDDGPFFAWQLRTGVLWRFSPNFGLNAGYRFINIGDAEIDDDIGNASFDLETNQHVLELGLKFGV